MNLLEIIRFAVGQKSNIGPGFFRKKDMPKVAVPHLSHQGFPKIQELVLLVVRRPIRIFRGEVIRSHPFIVHDVLSGTKPPNDKLVQHIISALRMHMLCNIIHRVFDVPTGVLEDELLTTGVVRKEVGDIEDFTPVGSCSLNCAEGRPMQ